MKRINRKFGTFVFLLVFAMFNFANSQDNLSSGISAIKRGDYVKAVELLQKAVKSEPNSYDANLYYGIALYETGALKDAEKYLKKAAGIDNEKPEAYNVLGQVHSAMKMYDEAERNFNDALKFSGANQTVESLSSEEIQLIVDILSNQAESYVAAGQVDKAINALTKAKSFDSKNPMIYAGLGNAYLVRGAFVPSATNYNEALALKGGYAPAYYGLGKSHFRQRKYTEALQQFDKAISADPNFADAYFEKGRLLYFNENYVQALDAFKKFSELKPGSPAGNTYYAKTLYAMGKLDEADALLDEVLKVNPESVDAMKFKAYIAIEKKDYAKAEEYFGKVKQEDLDAEDYLKMQKIYAERKDFLKAYDYINKAIAMDTTDPQGYFELGKAMFTNQEYPVALDNFNKAIDLGIQTVAAYIYKGITQYYLNDYPNAVMTLQKSIGLNPKVGSAYLWLGNSLAMEKKDQDAIAAYKKYLEFEPNDEFAKEQIKKLGGEL
jgi:tetratricopeptide (TPR) repeat protein